MRGIDNPFTPGLFNYNDPTAYVVLMSNSPHRPT
ncbi:hypothetical protein EPYR_03927 [Erwinia pyrifoliae DSM 12163]|nr:hypothetical protein EPYR_03927 [Erwinia pyrifoliae DSM 12163]